MVGDEANDTVTGRVDGFGGDNHTAYRNLEILSQHASRKYKTWLCS
jgi:hypothetical protein